MKIFISKDETNKNARQKSTRATKVDHPSSQTNLKIKQRRIHFALILNDRDRTRMERLLQVANIVPFDFVLFSYNSIL